MARVNVAMNAVPGVMDRVLKVDAFFTSEEDEDEEEEAAVLYRRDR